MSLTCRWAPAPPTPPPTAAPGFGDGLGDPESTLELTLRAGRRTLRLRFGRPSLLLRP